MEERAATPARRPAGIMARCALLGTLTAGIAFGLTHPGQGTIAFGRSYNADSGTIGDPAASFRHGEHFVWVAHFRQEAGTTQLTRTLSQREPSGHEASIAVVPVSMPDATEQGIYISADSAGAWEDALNLPAGDYTLRYWAGTTLLAEGQVRISN